MRNYRYTSNENILSLDAIYGKEIKFVDYTIRVLQHDAN